MRFSDKTDFRKFFKRQWPLIALGLLLSLAAFYIVKNGYRLSTDVVENAITGGEGLKLKDIHYTHNDPREGVKWILDAKEVKLSGDKKNIFFTDFFLTVESENRASIKVKGKRGSYSQDSGEINLWEDLEGFSEDGYRIVTEYLMVNEKAGHVSTDKPVKIYGPFFSVAGTGLFFDLSSERLKVLSDVTTTITKEVLI
ncbi:MAG: LPS export ABC transporter periplasmic protein LptC [Desulfatiglans sp.]|nr:LPS export ABC transporter periplasmic protein LptC [Desulfatiglans sp.]